MRCQVLWLQQTDICRNVEYIGPDWVEMLGVRKTMNIRNDSCNTFPMDAGVRFAARYPPTGNVNGLYGPWRFDRRDNANF
jgi:hypothetical protein